MSNEIERRFLTTSNFWKSKLDEIEHRIIKQGYPPELQKKGEFSRIRETTYQDGSRKFERCTKGLSDDISSPEDEWGVSDEESTKYFNSCDGQTLIKYRYFYPWTNGLIIHIDEFIVIRTKKVKLVISEIEFDTVEEARAFKPPKWLGEEITGKHEWSNFSLCTYGVPD